MNFPLIVSSKLIHDLNQVLMRAYADADTAKVEWCENYIQRLRDVSYRKLDEATAHMAKVIFFE